MYVKQSILCFALVMKESLCSHAKIFLSPINELKDAFLGFQLLTGHEDTEKTSTYFYNDNDCCSFRSRVKSSFFLLTTISHPAHNFAHMAHL